jgi:hypothetical protein
MADLAGLNAVERCWRHNQIKKEIAMDDREQREIETGASF